ncbi:MAG TPA: aminotransferase class I/II-fold pyridoxal phosphate-dependent enzyme [Syntrophales bacterium]|nr:aminotransferase class I/II-fold pyridoxal phosphate-dependent enzyme [Syntrophales bacterium]
MENHDDFISFSRRMDMLPPYVFGRINKLKLEKRKAGADIIDLAMGNPSDPTPRNVVDKLCEVVRDPRNHRYSVASGIHNLRREISLYYERQYGVSLSPDTEVLCTIGSKEGVSHLSLALLGPGDAAIVPVPAFPIHIYSAVIAGAEVVRVPHEDDETFLKSVDEICRTHSPAPKVLFLNFPHNPTARTVDLGFLEEAVRVARRRRLIIIHDFAYARVTFDGYEAPSILQVKGARDLAVEFGTLSKSYNMAGWRVGYCLGNPRIVDALSRIKGYYDYGLFQAVQIAAIIALRHCDKEILKQAAIYQSRRDVLCDGLNSIGWKVEKPRASMFIWAPIPEPFRALGSMEYSVRLMEEAEVAVSPGIAFGPEGDGYLRIALVENENRIRQAIRQIKRLSFTGMEKKQAAGAGA